ncbi:hypothetical protein D8S78_06605 [Natrialba swarupiae]|nr:hypothetical protein [Natrialba swarupiae]
MPAHPRSFGGYVGTSEQRTVRDRGRAEANAEGCGQVSTGWCTGGRHAGETGVGPTTEGYVHEGRRRTHTSGSGDQRGASIAPRSVPYR